jgi:Diadenosine tetraphosphate (Ap4A) hydrolase and other HIT family hydrolases
MCQLCNPQNEKLIFKNDLFRIILIDDEFYPGFVRLILNNHVKEMSDLSDTDANSVFAALIFIEKTIRQLFNPDKINLASLGNVVPHLHWHIIPRYTTDRHFPNPIWGCETNLDYKPLPELLRMQDKLFTLLKQELK